MNLKIFIASSGRAQGLAQQFADRLLARLAVVRKTPPNIGLNVKPILWWESFGSGEYTLESLIGQCETCDFAAVFLTEDDITLKNATGDPMVKPRDNCIYEAGLFTGGLSLEKERTFLLTSAQKPLDVLPSDLAGLTHTPITEKGDGVDTDLDLAAKKILAEMIDQGPHRRKMMPYVPGEVVMQNERPEAEHGRLESFSRILVQNRQPLEVNDPLFAQRVQRNIRDEIRYRYFFHGHKGSIGMIATLIWRLATSGIEGDVPQQINKIKDNPELALNNLNAISDYLTIQFLAQPPPFELCVHNSESDEKAVCYVRAPLPEGPIQFIEWCRGPAAAQIALSYLDLRMKPKEPTTSIFRSTVTFDLLDQKEYVRDLCTAIVKRFPAKIQPEICKVCFPASCLSDN